MSKKAVGLEYLLPEKATFKSKKTGKTYNIREMNLDDQVWFKQLLKGKGKKDIETLFGGADGKGDVDIEFVCLWGYRMLDQDGRKEFRAYDLEEFDDNGDETSKRITGPEVMRRNLVWPVDVLDLLQALLKSAGISQPELEPVDVGQLKKNETASKKPRKPNPIGAKSLTSSPPNTVGQKPKSAPSP